LVLSSKLSSFCQKKNLYYQVQLILQLNIYMYTREESLKCDYITWPNNGSLHYMAS